MESEGGGRGGRAERAGAPALPWEPAGQPSRSPPRLTPKFNKPRRRARGGPAGQTEALGSVEPATGLFTASRSWGTRR